MKFSSLALLAFVALERAHPAYSFVSPPSADVTPFRGIARPQVVEMSTESDGSTSDVSIPYDAAAELAYKGWIEQYDRPYDAERYKVFLDNYKAITVMNTAAKQKARETGGKPNLLSLNKFADCTAEEYEAAMNGESKSSSDDSSSETEEAPATSGNILGDAVKAVESQASASSALQEAADALEAEEAVRWKDNIMGSKSIKVLCLCIHPCVYLFVRVVLYFLPSHTNIWIDFNVDRNWPLNWV